MFEKNLPAHFGGIPANTDFRIWIQIETTLLNVSLDASSRMAQALLLAFGDDIPTDVEGAVNWLIWFYRCGGRDTAPKDSKGKPTNEVYSYEHDAEYIYGAFMEQYGVDLYAADLHWWKFRAMFKSLQQDCQFVKIMGYRSMEIDGKMSKEMQAHYREMKRVYALPIPEGEKKRRDKIIEALKNGGDVAGVL